MIKFSDICDGKYYVIPENQRGFRRGASQGKDLIENLELANTQSRYMGPLIISQTSLNGFQDDRYRSTLENTL